MVNVILTTRSLTFHQVNDAVDNFYKQDLLSKQLIIANNYPSWEMCLQLNITSTKYVSVFDKPFASDIKAEADLIAESSRYIACLPKYDVPNDLLSTWVVRLIESEASIIHDGRGCYLAKKRIIPKPYVHDRAMDEIISLASCNNELLIKDSF